jgi:hypothetical protein
VEAAPAVGIRQASGVMPKTGNTCPQSGIYRGDCRCSKAIALRKGEAFPVCHSCRQRVHWRLIRSTK